MRRLRSNPRRRPSLPRLSLLLLRHHSAPPLLLDPSCVAFSTSARYPRCESPSETSTSFRLDCLAAKRRDYMSRGGAA